MGLAKLLYSVGVSKLAWSSVDIEKSSLLLIKFVLIISLLAKFAMFL